MPKRGVAALAITTVALVLLLNFKTPDDTVPTRPTGNVEIVEPGTGVAQGPRSTAAPRATADAASDRHAAASAATGGGAGNASTTVDGPVVETRFGPVQVEAVVAGGRLQDVVALQLPTGRRSGQISNHSEPILRQEAAPGPERQHRHRVRGDLHERRVLAVAPGGARPGRHRMIGTVVPELRRVESVMGTTVSIDVRPPLVAPVVLDQVVDQLRDIDARFSTYRPDSEVSRLARGEIRPEECSLDVRHVLAACDHLAAVTDGAFDARRHRADGRLDPSGFVKGWAVEEAAWLIDSAGGRNYWINAGGDIVARGHAEGGRAWRVGIRHPDLPDRVAAVLAVSDRAVATSGSYERGAHIIDPASGRTPTGLRSVTVVGPGLAFTDAYATAVYVMGLDGLRWLDAYPDYAAYAITDDDRAVWTEGMERYLVRDD